MIDDPFGRVCSALGHRIKRRQGRDKIHALCPAHDDHNPSLVVSRGEKGVVLHCHLGCSTKDVLAALCMEERELFYDASPQTSSRQIVATYDYCDLHGEVQYSVCRLSPKGFFQQRADGEKTKIGRAHV